MKIRILYFDYYGKYMQIIKNGKYYEFRLNDDKKSLMKEAKDMGIEFIDYKKLSKEEKEKFDLKKF